MLGVGIFAAAGLAVAVAVDVGGINMNTGVNTGKWILMKLFSLYIIFTIPFWGDYYVRVYLDGNNVFLC